jgi:phosphomethylpyrimidine synthase
MINLPVKINEKANPYQKQSISQDPFPARFLVFRMIQWHHEEDFNLPLDITHTYDVTFGLGDGFRPGTVVDATDGRQVWELIAFGELARRIRACGVHMMIEGLGHLLLNQVVANLIMERRLCDGAPFYLLRPLATDIPPGYDYITGAIGGAILTGMLSQAIDPDWARERVGLSSDEGACTMCA